MSLITSTTSNPDVYQNGVRYRSRVTNCHVNGYQVVQGSHREVNQAAAVLGPNVSIPKESVHVSQFGEGVKVTQSQIKVD